MEKQAQDIFRPEMHFTPPFGWMNDPNGLVCINEEFHLFYQYYPLGNKWGPMHWGHAVSDDFLNWEHLPIALAPDDKTGMCFSGSAFVDWKNTSGLFNDQQTPGIVAYYTNCIAPTDGTDGVQSQSMAFSKDGGFSWEKVNDNPVIENPGMPDFRDPKVIWHEESQHWILVITEGQEVGIYRSADMKAWEKTSTFGAIEGAHDDLPWECPDLFPIKLENRNETYWVLIIGVQGGSYAGGSGTQYFIGQFDGKQFINHHSPEVALWMDYGRDFYAAQSWSDILDGQRVAIAWMSNWQYANEVPTKSWRSAMSAPRELKLIQNEDGLRLSQSLPKQWPLKSIGDPVNTTLPESAKMVLDSRQSAGVMSFTLDMAEGSSLKLAPYGDESLFYLICKTAQGYMLMTERNVIVEGEEKYNDTFAQKVEVIIPFKDSLPVQLIRDRCSCELLLGDGTYTMTDLCFTPEWGECQIEVVSGEVVINNFALQMRA